MNALGALIRFPFVLCALLAAALFFMVRCLFSLIGVLIDEIDERISK